MTQLIYDDLSDFQRWILVHANSEKLSEALSVKGFDVGVSLNGVDIGIDFQELASEIESQMNRMVERRVSEEIASKFDEVISRIEKAKDLFQLDD